MSIDALGCQTDIAQAIADRGVGYLLAVKDNQSDLHAHLWRDFAYMDCTCTIMGDAQRHPGRTRSRPPLGLAVLCATASPTCP